MHIPIISCFVAQSIYITARRSAIRRVNVNVNTVGGWYSALQMSCLTSRPPSRERVQTATYLLTDLTARLRIILWYAMLRLRRLCMYVSVLICMLVNRYLVGREGSVRFDSLSLSLMLRRPSLTTCPSLMRVAGFGNCLMLLRRKYYYLPLIVSWSMIG
jgi:hypothetical protein